MAETYNVFISWSGPRSNAAAEALKQWLPLIVPAANPWMSATDIDKGTRWREEVATALDTMKAGIICLTPENLAADWLLFEAGALSKTHDPKTRVWTYLLADLKPQHLKDPLRMFQATAAEQEDTRKLVHSINKNLDGTAPESRVNHLFDKLWPDLEKELIAIAAQPGTAPPKRPLEEILAEILELSRAAAQSRKSVEDLDEYIPVFKQFLPMLAEAMTGAQNQTAHKASMYRTSSTQVPQTFLVKQHDDAEIKRIQGTTIIDDRSGNLVVLDEAGGVIARFANVEEWRPETPGESTQEKPTPSRRETWVSRGLKEKIKDA